MNNLNNLSIEDLQKLKLQQEILLLKKPVWQQTPFISIVVTLIIAFTGTSITLWQNQKAKVEFAEKERKRYENLAKDLEKEKADLKEKTGEANLRYTTATSQMSEAIAEKTEVKNQINALQEINLIKREKSLRDEIAKLQRVTKILKEQSNGYKSGFAHSFVLENRTVQKDIEHFTKDGMKQEMENWLMKQFLFTALGRYQAYIAERSDLFLGNNQ